LLPKDSKFSRLVQHPQRLPAAGSSANQKAKMLHGGKSIPSGGGL
jgi:hypothetical protein